MKTNWELGKELSNYHFDKSVKDTDSVQICGRFIGDWKDELENAYNTIFDVTWSNRWSDLGKKDPRGDLSENELADIINAGGNPDQPMYQGSYDIGPVMQKMIDALGMENSRHKLHIQYTGELVSMHMDKHYDVAGGIEARRFLIALEDWEPGQFMVFGNQSFCKFFINFIPSAFYNIFIRKFFFHFLNVFSSLIIKITKTEQ